MLRMLIILAVCLPNLIWAMDFDRQQLQQRIKPYGQVRLEEQPDDAKPAAEEAAVVQEEVPTGERVYGQYCKTCHQRGLAGAPVFRKAAAWQPLLAKKSVDDLTTSAIKGINAMPAKGTCNSCSDDDIRAAVKYMLPQE